MYREYNPMVQEHEGIECLVGDSLRQVPCLVTKSSSVKVSLSALG
jgi:hypothetical protein